ncbi:hypothetical protein [Amycolatopsis nigrescens]|uniref:hypothetical protein n=1 Tax=Amycolatopsis nigrescens TaxID=381445 RepID=UPI00038286E0|nr:hypothetical protein [Amycolatopsis nigrescens]
MTPQVVVTGAGVVCSVAQGLAGFAHTFGCEVTGFEPGERLRVLDPADWGRAAQSAAVNGRMAARDAGFSTRELRARRGLVCVGTAT